MKVLMVGVDKRSKGGMWTVVANYLKDKNFCEKYNIKYIATSTPGNVIKKILFNFVAIVKIFFYTLFNNYDILHVHMSEKGSVYRKGIIINISKIRKCKVVIHMHGAELEKWYNTLNKKQKKQVRKIINKGDKILILGNYWKEFIGSLLDDKSKIEVLYNAVEVPENNKYDIASKNILFLGAITKRKGIYDLLKAFQNLKKEIGFDYKLLIYGPDCTDEGIKTLINKYNVQDIVKYLGWLKAEEKEKVFENVSINILPSYNEGLPMTILETMANGIPNISTKIAAIPEVINSNNGILINPGDVSALTVAIKELATNEKLRIHMSNKSFDLIKTKFSLEKHIEQLESIYKNLK